jgi:hypothetical protein
MAMIVLAMMGKKGVQGMLPSPHTFLLNISAISQSAAPMNVLADWHQFGSKLPVTGRFSGRPHLFFDGILESGTNALERDALHNRIEKAFDHQPFGFLIRDPTAA